MLRIASFAALTTFVTIALSKCYDPSPAFPVPAWSHATRDLGPAFNAIEKRLKDVIAAEKYDVSSFSVELTSNTESLWSQFHTARKRNETRPGAAEVDGDSLYRVASITKVFTTLGLLYEHQAGNLSLDDPISEYIPELSGEVPWKDITLRILASQLSGIPRDFAQGDLINAFKDPTAFGFPPASKDALPHCDSYNHYIPCNATDLVGRLKKFKPLFAPNQMSTYSNVNFELIGLAIERVTGLDYKQYILERILNPLGMKLSSLDTPSDGHAVLPLGKHYWGVDEGVQNPTGGIYSSSSDMSKFVRYILTHFNALATGVNWMMPASWAGGIQSFYGMPFEIFRTDAILKDSTRPVTFVTKSGGLPGYTSRIYIMPEYGLGLTILIAGQDETGALLSEIEDIVTVEVVQAAEKTIWEGIEKTYPGFYTATDRTLNSSLELASSPSTGLILNSFISNGTDVLETLLSRRLVGESLSWRVQLIPTLLYKEEKSQRGEIWRALIANDRTETTAGRVWDEFCTTDVDTMIYAGLPANEVVFWHDEGIVELPAWKVKLKASQPEKLLYWKLVAQDSWIM